MPDTTNPEFIFAHASNMPIATGLSLESVPVITVSRLDATNPISPRLMFCCPHCFKDSEVTLILKANS